MFKNKSNLIIILLIFSPIFILGLALLLISIPLPEPFPDSGSNARNLLAAILTGILGLAWVAALSIYLINNIFSAGRIFETAFTARGLSASNYLILGRQYHGILDGRQVEAQFFPGRMLQNSLLNIRIEIDVNQRIAIGMAKPLLACNNCRKVDITPYELGNIQVYAEDILWIQNYLSNPCNVEQIKILMDNTEGLGRREFYLQNKQAWLHARPTPRLTAVHLHKWLLTLNDLISSI